MKSGAHNPPGVVSLLALRNEVDGSFFFAQDSNMVYRSSTLTYASKKIHTPV